MLAFKYSDGALPNGIALSIILTGYTLSLAGLFADSILWLLAVFMLSQSMVLAAYLLHDCLHGAVFRLKKHNDALGQVLSWVVGSNYSRLKDLQDKHLRHHRERSDILGIDLNAWVERSAFLSPLLSALAFIHFPVRDVLGRIAIIVLPFIDQRFSDRRSYVLSVLLLRGCLLGSLFVISPIAWLGYCLACCVAIAVLSFMDFSQHDYPLEYRLLDPARKPQQDAQYEESHTFSNLLSRKFPWFNFLVLNFCYHNAHHKRPGEPWYRLPKLHNQLYADDCPQEINLTRQLQRFHEYRLIRLQHVDTDKDAGVDGVSFLVSV